jgi:hypothetical protein
MVLLNTSGVIGAIISSITINIIGNELITGLWLLLLLFGIMTAFNITAGIAVVMLIPMTIVLSAYGYVHPVAAGIIIILSGVLAGYNFFNKG